MAIYNVITNKTQKIASDNCGVAAIEFALVLPLLLLLFLGGFEVSRFLLIHQKADRVAYTITDVVTQSTSITRNQLEQILHAATQIMQPFEFADSGIVIISSIYQDNNSPTPIIRWQYSGGGKLSRNSKIGRNNGSASLPNNLTLNNNENVIISEVFFTYTPIFPLEILPAVEIYKAITFKPRLGVLTTPPV